MVSEAFKQLHRKDRERSMAAMKRRREGKTLRMVYWVKYETPQGNTVGAWFDYDFAQYVYKTCQSNPKFGQDGNQNLRIESEVLAVEND